MLFICYFSLNNEIIRNLLEEGDFLNQNSIPIKQIASMHDWNTIEFIYGSALKLIDTKISILNDEFQERYQYNPIEHVKSRLKTKDSIKKKLKRHGYDFTIDNVIDHCHDIAGIRITCSFIKDIYLIAEMLKKHKDLNIIRIQDYNKHPKKSGYRSYHMNIEVPVVLTDGVFHARVEIQIRTAAQDFWATLEHKMHYKFEGDGPDYISRELRACAEYVADLDQKMQQLNDEIHEYDEKKNTDPDK